MAPYVPRSEECPGGPGCGHDEALTDLGLSQRYGSVVIDAQSGVRTVPAQCDLDPACGVSCGVVETVGNGVP